MCSATLNNFCAKSIERDMRTTIEFVDLSHAWFTSEDQLFVYPVPGLRKEKKMSLQGVVYNALLKRSSTFVLTIMAGSFFFERTFDLIADGLFEKINEGKLWKDIKHKYEKDE